MCLLYHLAIGSTYYYCLGIKVILGDRVNTGMIMPLLKFTLGGLFALVGIEKFEIKKIYFERLLYRPVISPLIYTSQFHPK